MPTMKRAALWPYSMPSLRRDGSKLQRDRGRPQEAAAARTEKEISSNSNTKVVVAADQIVLSNQTSCGGRGSEGRTDDAGGGSGAYGRKWKRPAVARTGGTEETEVRWTQI
jgi:hypothetical protein